MANTVNLFRSGAVGFIDWLDGGRAIILCCHWPSMEDKNLAVDLGLFEILPALSWLRFAGDKHRLFESRDTPILIRNSIACVRLGFFSRRAINPAVLLPRQDDLLSAYARSLPACRSFFICLPDLSPMASPK